MLVALAVLVPGIWRYSLVDPWETHYGEVARDDAAGPRLGPHRLARHERRPKDDEGFRSKPVLTFWLMAAGMRAVGVADDGGYSGEMVHDARTMVAIRMPFILCGVLGLMLMWWMLARLVSRGAWRGSRCSSSARRRSSAWSRGKAIPDMPLVRA